MNRLKLFVITFAFAIGISFTILHANQSDCEGITITQADATWCNETVDSMSLVELLDGVSSRVYVQYTDANREELLVNSTILNGLLEQVADRVFIQYADANRIAMLMNNTALNDVLQQAEDRVYFQFADAGRRFELERPCDLLGDDVPPTVVGGITAQKVAGELVISWTTDEDATTVVEYGTVSGSYTDSVSDGWIVTEHVVNLGDLPDGTYYFRVQSTDGCANTFVSQEQVIEFFRIPNVIASKTVNNSEPLPGDTIEYTLRVTNTGDITLNTTVVDTLPEHVTPNDPLTWSPVLAPSEAWSETVAVTIDEDYIGPLTNLLSVTTVEGVRDNVTNSIHVVDPVDLCGASITSVRSGNWFDPTTWDVGRVPNASDVVAVRPEHAVDGTGAMVIAGLCNYGRIDAQTNLQIIAAATVQNFGEIIGESSSNCTTGSHIELRGAPIYNEGIIQAGHGGSEASCGGDGGDVMIFGRNTTNHGTICAGRGGDVAGTGAGNAGDGGDAHIWGKSGGSGFLLNDGLLCAGDGGDGNPAATAPQNGGCGGRLRMMAAPVYLSGGTNRSGRRGIGTGGGLDGCRSRIAIDPNLIDISGDTAIIGDDVLIYGGDDWVLDLSNLNGVAITATNNITLSVGDGGVVDMHGNQSPIFKAGNSVVIASDQVVVDSGMTVADLADAPTVDHLPSDIVYDVSLTGATFISATDSSQIAIPFTLLNSGPMDDNYVVTVSDTIGWTITPFDTPIALAGLEMSDLSVLVEPDDSVENRITITATSQTDPTRKATLIIDVSHTVSEISYHLYLPTIVRD